MENKILIDWLSFTSKIDSTESIINLLGLDDIGIKWTTMNGGGHGFQERLYFGGISIHFNNKNFDGVWVEMCGAGCRSFDEFSSSDWFDIFYKIVDDTDNYNITRLDVAYDDKLNVLNLNKIYKETLQQRYISKFTSYECIKSNLGLTVYIGSKKSEILFRIYDKAMERGREDEGHWVRFEMQLRDKRALSFIQQLNFDNVGTLFTGVLNNYIRYVIPSDDTNKSRWKSQKWWVKFTQNAEKISLWTKCNTDYNLAKCEDYVYKQCGNAIDALLKIKGADTVFKELKKNKPIQAKKYATLINENCNNGVFDYLAERDAL